MLLHVHGSSLHGDGAQLSKIGGSARVRRRAGVVDTREARCTRLVVYRQLVSTKWRRRLCEVGQSLGSIFFGTLSLFIDLQKEERFRS